MKKLLLLQFVCVLVMGSAWLAAYHNQNERVRKGDLVILNPNEGVFSGGRVFVDKTTKTITSKASVFPITLWEDKAGNVYAQHHMIQYTAYIVANLPVSKDELALYRGYFP